MGVRPVALRELPHGDLRSTGVDGAIIFSGIAQPWLKEAAKRWVHARLLAGGAPSTMANYVLHVRAFSTWLAERALVAGDHLVGGRVDRRGPRGIEPSGCLVDQRRRLLHVPVGVVDGLGHVVIADREVDQRPLGLRAPVVLGRYLDRAHRI